MPIGMEQDAGGDITEQALLQAIKRRILEEIKDRQRAAAPIVNNVYGNHQGAGGGAGGLTGSLGYGGEQGGNPDDFDYMVDISRQDMQPGDIDPTTGQPFTREGWIKRVHRHRKKKVTGPTVEEPSYREE